EALFQAALIRPREARETFLDEALSEASPEERGELRQRLEAMLRAEEAESPLLEDLVGGAVSLLEAPQAGQRLGAYRLLRLLGEGGMGVV
ncbi:MAG: hypothetical protein KDD47_17855, partial [Acidobacteria bacterium]|nr:hypothetical protein [Acidobacteriota bacterium]